MGGPPTTGGGETTSPPGEKSEERLTDSELRLLDWLVRVAKQFVPANHVAAEYIPALLTRIAAISGCSSTRTPQPAHSRQLWAGNGITTSDAAERLGVTQRAIQQRIQRGTLPAHRVGRTWVIYEEDL